VPEQEVEKAQEVKQQIGPGGLDAQKVFEELPTMLQEAFYEHDQQKLQAGFAQLPDLEAKRLLKRCIDAGLWVMPSEYQDSSSPSPADDRDTSDEEN